MKKNRKDRCNADEKIVRKNSVGELENGFWNGGSRTDELNGDTIRLIEDVV